MLATSLMNLKWKFISEIVYSSAILRKRLQNCKYSNELLNFKFLKISRYCCTQNSSAHQYSQGERFQDDCKSCNINCYPWCFILDNFFHFSVSNSYFFTSLDPCAIDAIFLQQISNLTGKNCISLLQTSCLGR